MTSRSSANDSSAPTSGRGRTVACGAAAAVAAAVVWAALAASLPPALAATLLPAAAALAAGSLAAVGLAARTEPRYRRLLACLGFGAAVAVVTVSVALAVEPTALDRHSFRVWMPPVAGAGMLTWVAAYLADMDHPRASLRRDLLTALLGGLTLGAVLLADGKSVHDALEGKHLRTWNVYHYYLGAKYFDELGYTDLYAATLAADDEWQASRRTLAEPAAPSDGGTGFAHIRDARDLASYRVVPREVLTSSFDRSRFADERWADFGRDTRWLRPWLDAPTWQLVLRDWGYNPAPPRVAVDGWITEAVDLDGFAFRFVSNSDLPLFVAMFGCLWWAFGLRVALAATLWAHCIHFNRGRFAGGFLQYDWLASCVIAVSCFAKGRFRWAGVALSWAVMTRGFPALLALPVVASMGTRWLRASDDTAVPSGRGWRAAVARFRPGHLEFLIALGAACAVWLLLSFGTARGPAAWTEWIANMQLHRQALPADPAHLGIARLAFHRPAPSAWWAACRDGVDACLAARAVPMNVARAVGSVLLVAALVRRRTVDAMILMLFAAFLWLTMTRYYGTIWMLLFALGSSGSAERITRPAALAGAALLGMAAAFYLPPGNEARYFLVNYAALATFVALCIHYLVADGWLRRQRA